MQEKTTLSVLKSELEVLFILKTNSTHEKYQSKNRCIKFMSNNRKSLKNLCHLVLNS